MKSWASSPARRCSSSIERVLAQDPDLAWDIRHRRQPASTTRCRLLPMQSTTPYPTPRPDAGGRRRRLSRRWVIAGAVLAALASVGAVFRGRDWSFAWL